MNKEKNKIIKINMDILNEVEIASNKLKILRRGLIEYGIEQDPEVIRIGSREYSHNP